jgi:peptidoglycan hydrolase-like protein with peptidoglycan-binding domain
MPVQEVDSRSLPPLKNDPAKTNWWEKVGGLPDLVTRIAKHLVSERGKTESTAIATAISQVRKVCATGLTFGGRTPVHADTKAEYCKAAAEIEAKRAAAKGKSAVADSDLSAQDALSLACYATEKLSVLAEQLGGDWIIDAIREREFSTSKRKRAAKKGTAMPDGSFPIESKQDLQNAMRAIGRAPKEKRAKVKAHIKRRAKAVGMSVSESELTLAEEVSEEVILLNALAEVFTPPEGLSEAFVIPPLGKLRQQVRANRKADNRKSSSSSSKSTSGQKRAPAGTSEGGQFISTGGTGPVITGIRKKIGLGQNASAEKTKSRIEQLQRKNGLEVDGIIGRQTATFLLSGKKVKVGKVTTGMRSRLRRRLS